MNYKPGELSSIAIKSMPERQKPRFMALDSFTQRGEPFDKNYGSEDIHAEKMAQIIQALVVGFLVHKFR